MIAAHDILVAAAQDTQAQLGPEHPALLGYVNRVHLDILKLSRWKFLLSAPQRFLTRPGITDYWIGPTGAQAIGQYDTGLNVGNIQSVRRGTVFDRSNYKLLGRTEEPPDLNLMAYQDTTSRLGRPRLWRNASDTPNVLNIYPAPDNQNGYVPVPPAPALSTQPGGSLPARMYFVTGTLVDSLGGESAQSPETSLYIPANNLLVVGPPTPGFASNASGVQYGQYRVYAAATSGAETRQTPSAVPISTQWVEPPTGLTASIPAPANPTLAPLGGYVIEFRYFQTRNQITDPGQPLQIPDDYFDVVVAGVNQHAFQLLGAQNPVYLNQAAFWKEQYAALKGGMIRDANMFPRGGEFIKPDSAALTQTTNSNSVLDLMEAQI